MSGLAALFIENIAPILLLAGIGVLLHRTLRIDVTAISRLIFFAFAPALVFTLLIDSQIAIADLILMSSFALAVTIATGLLSLLVARALRLPPSLAAAFILVATFMNSGNFGLPLNLFAFGPEALAWASIYFITSAMLTISLGVVVATAGKSSFRHILGELLRVPALYAVVAALLVRAAGWNLPSAILRPIELLSAASIPSMLILLGLQVSSAGAPRLGRLIAAAAGIRLLVSPALAWLLALGLGLTGAGRQAAILESAMPTAVLTTVLALEYRVEPEFVTGAVLATTLLSPFTLTPILALLGG